MRVPDGLRRLLVQRQCVAFVGAGLSMACGMPGWGGLLGRLIEEARGAVYDTHQQRSLEMAEYLLSQGNYTLAASHVKQILNPVELNRAIWRQYSVEAYHAAHWEKRKRMEERLRNLVHGPWAGIITTNYDTLIEWAIGNFTRGNYIECGAWDEDFGLVLCGQSSTGRFFVKIHGSVKGGGYVLGTEEYDATYLAAPRIEAFLSASMLRNHHVFIGCSIEDEILRLRRRLCQNFNRRIPEAYAILPRTIGNEARRQWLEDNARIKALLYDTNVPSSAPDEHGELDEFLKTTAIIGEGEADCRAGPLSVGLMKNMRDLSLKERVKNVGAINKELLRMAYQARERGGLAHTDIVNMEFDGANRSLNVRAITPNERVYRVLFLSAIGLLDPYGSDGEVAYTFPHDPSLFE